MPGDGGSQFEGKLNRSDVPHIWCTKLTDDWFPLWLNLELLVPYVLDCFTDNMRWEMFGILDDLLRFMTCIYISYEIFLVQIA